MKRAAAIRHLPFEDLGTWANVLTGRGFQLRYHDAGRTDLARINPLEPDLLVVLGGPIGAGDDDEYPFLATERELLRRRLEADRPTLGICLGAQLMASALGARVYAAPRPEIGWAPVRLTDAGRGSCLTALGDPSVPVLHWHGDSFDLPGRAALLASTDACANQAFGYGRKALALQFHPEVTATGLEQWYIGHTREIVGNPTLTVAGLREAGRRHAPGLQAPAWRMLERWLEETGLVPPPAPETPDSPY
ncbi:MAG TPA: glutamine amidotransferase [Gammaproteobacteria bacterium]|nr:glutamine amidotransferase [Gammaproteobacteria bacterium]